MNDAARASFVSRLRERLEDGVSPSPHRPLVALEGPLPDIRYRPDLADLGSAFTDAASGVGATVRRVSPKNVPDLLAEVVASEGITTAVVSADPECDGVEDVLGALGVEVLPLGDPAVVARADLGVTGAVAGVALTGSLLVDARRAGSRTVSLLPPVHLALINEDVLAATPGDLLRPLSTARPSSLSSNLVFITGPSRSADIELQITPGVHGPGHVWIGLLSSPPGEESGSTRSPEGGGLTW